MVKQRLNLAGTDIAGTVEQFEDNGAEAMARPVHEVGNADPKGVSMDEYRALIRVSENAGRREWEEMRAKASFIVGERAVHSERNAGLLRLWRRVCLAARAAKPRIVRWRVRRSDRKQDRSSGGSGWACMHWRFID